MDSGQSPVWYGTEYLTNQTIVNDTDTGRQWVYQYCTQFGWLQACPFDSDTALRSKYVGIPLFVEQCLNSFPDAYPVIAATQSQVKKLNTNFGGVNIKATNLIISNAGEDPW